MDKNKRHEWRKNVRLTNMQINRGKYNCYIFYVGNDSVNQFDVEEMNIYQALDMVEKLANENKGVKIVLKKDYDFGGNEYPFNQRRTICELTL